MIDKKYLKLKQRIEELEAANGYLKIELGSYKYVLSVVKEFCSDLESLDIQDW